MYFCKEVRSWGDISDFWLHIAEIDECCIILIIA